MIKNIIFDIGNVLLNFKPEKYIGKYYQELEMQKNLLKIIFQDKRWAECDRGTYKIEEYKEMLIKENPNFKKEIEKILNPEWVEIHTPKKESIIFLKELRQKGYGIFLLSNISEEAYEYCKRTYDFMNLVTGGIYSYQINCCKPEETMYQILLDTYKLKPEECIFLDDSPKNIEASQNLGINSILFHDIQQAKQEVEKIIGMNTI